MRGLASQARHHEIVLDRAIVVEEQCITLHALLEARDIGGGHALQRAGGVVAGQKRLPHMRHIEQACLRTRMQMFLQDAGGILHRHFIAGERHHLAAKLQMERVKRRAAKRFVGGIGHSGPDKRLSLRMPANRYTHPSVMGPERFPRR